MSRWRRARTRMLAIVDVRLPPSYTDEGLRAALAARSQVPGLLAYLGR